MFAVAQARAIIAVSEATKKDIVKLYGADSAKVSVIHHGYEQKPNVYNSVSNVISGLPDKFVLFLSTIQPRKNLVGLIDAFTLLKKENPEITHKLVVIGRPGWKFESALQKMEDHKDIVVYLNHVSDTDRLLIMGHASLLVLPSFYEGFGMQILEAFDANVPVACSNISSMPEVAGDAAVYFSPYNVDEIKSAIKNVLTNTNMVRALQEKGKKRLDKFGWKKCAEETLNVLEGN